MNLGDKTQLLDGPLILIVGGCVRCMYMPPQDELMTWR